MNEETTILATVITAAVVAIVSAIAARLVTFAVQERKLRADLRTEFMAERVLLALLKCDK